MVQMEPERIVYVSCDSATLARDVKYLRENGYEIRKVKATDMFPMSVHVETCVLLQKTNYVEILNFRHFFKHIVFTSEGDKIRNKEIKNYINVSVVVDIECGDTTN